MQSATSASASKKSTKVILLVLSSDRISSALAVRAHRKHRHASRRPRPCGAVVTVSGTVTV
eukprot:648369-Pyramimonas_sp.AAC.1